MRTVRFPHRFRPAILAALTFLGILAFGAGTAGAASLEASFETVSPVSDVRVGYLDAGVQFGPKSGASWRLDVTLDAAGPVGDVQPSQGVMLSAEGSRVDYAFSSTLTGSYENTSRGIVQTFEIAAPPSSGTMVAIELALGGNVTARFDRKLLNMVEFQSAGKTVLRLAAVVATDATGAEVPIAVELDGSVLRIVMQRAAAEYPVTVEGVFAGPKTRRTRPAFDASVPDAPLTPMAPPANDLCVGAIVIPSGGAFPHTTANVNLSEATTVGDPAEATCAFEGEPLTRSIWYSFTPSASGTYTFSTCADTPTATTVDDTVMALYTSTGGCAGTLTEVPGACDDDSCVTEALQAFLSAPLTSGTTYYLVVWNLGPAPQVGFQNVQLVVGASTPNPPPNDTCGGAVVVPGAGPFPFLSPTIANVSDAGTADDPPAPSCLPGGFVSSRSVWYSFTPSATGPYVISTCSEGGETATTTKDTIIAIYTSAAGCAGPFTEIPTVGSSDGCDDDTCGGVESLQSYLPTSLAAGTQYWILVSQVDNDPLPTGETALQLRVASATAPVNDTCTAATGLTLNIPVAGTTLIAVDDYRSPAVAGCYSGVGNTTTSAEGRDVVYAFTPPITASYSFKITGYDGTSGRNLAVYVASDCPTAGAPPRTVTCVKGANRNSSSSSEEVNCISLTAATPAYVYVDETSATSGSTFTLEVNRCFVETEPNDTPATASVKTCGTEGTITPAFEVDFFALGTHPAGNRIFAMADGAAAGTTDFDLRVTTDLDTIEFDDVNLVPPFGELSPVIAGAPLTAAASYLRVNISPLSGIQASEPYRLYSAKQPPIASAAAETEPNGTTAQASSAPGGYFLGTLAAPAPSTDVDLYSFTATVGDLIFLAVDGDPTRDNTPINAALALLNTAGTTLVAVNDGAFVSSVESGLGGVNKTTPFSPGEGLTWRARYTGTYYARVAVGAALVDPSGAGNYLLSVSLNCQPTDDPDGDGATGANDCAPNDPGVMAIPGEVPSLVFSTKTALAWATASGGSSATYDAVRGDRTALPVGPGGGEETCFPGLATTTVTDSTLPPQGNGFWYLARARNSCGVGTYGRQGLRGVPGTVRTTTTCP